MQFWKTQICYVTFERKRNIAPENKKAKSIPRRKKTVISPGSTPVPAPAAEETAILVPVRVREEVEAAEAGAIRGRIAGSGGNMERRIAGRDHRHRGILIG